MALRGVTSGRGIAEFHRQANAFAGHVHLGHAHFDDVAGFDHLARIGHKLVAQLADVYQPVLVHAQVDERAECGHVAHGAFQFHAFAQVLYIVHAVVETGHLEVRARVTAWFFQLGHDVFDRDDTELVVGKQLGLEGFEHVSAAHQLSHGLAGVGHDLLDDRIGLGVNASHVQWIGAFPGYTQAQKSSALLKGFCPQARHLEQVGP